MAPWLADPAAFTMTRAMLVGLKRRADALAAVDVRPRAESES